MSYTIQHYRQQKRNHFYATNPMQHHAQPSLEDRLARLEYENKQLKIQLQNCMDTMRRMNSILHDLSKH